MDNIAILVRAGYPRAAAIRGAFDAARMSYFKRYPEGALPAWLAYPHGRLLKKYYTDGGAPINTSIGKNPVRELDIDPDELADIQRDVQKQLAGRGAAVRKAAALYTDFTGHTDPQLTKVSVPQIPKAVVAIGQIDGIMYSTVRDGVAEKYIHRFRKNSRPLLTAAPDGKQLYVIGGSYNFTDRGIEDT